MDPSTWDRVRELFAAALERASAQRESFVRTTAADDTELASEVLALLDSHVDDDTFLQAPGEITPPRQIGLFELGPLIGRGGAGVVHLATQATPHREVALKLLRPGALSPTAAKRFTHEAELLGRLHHPGIAQVYAAGTEPTTAGPMPWLAMELVADAAPLTRFARERGLDLRARLALFLQVCDAVHHGHQKGVIHRDLKPANVLVGTDGVVKVIDFGVARELGGESAQQTRNTLAGELIGTLAYMSPEQCAGHSDAVDTRSDVYALGVILYELLTDRLPIATDDQPLHEALRAVIEHAPTRAPDLPIDVEAIALKAMEKAPERRYAGAAALADDLRRYLASEPVIARPPSLTWQLRLLARRHRAVVVSAALVVLMLVAATAVSATFAVRADRRAQEAEDARSVATTERTAAEETLAILLEAVRAANPFVRQDEITVAQLLDQVAGQLAARSTLDPKVQARMHTALAKAYRGLARTAPAIEHAQAALTLFENLEGDRPRERAALLNLLGIAQLEALDYDSAIASLEQALALLESSPTPDAELQFGVITRLATAHGMAHHDAAADRYVAHVIEGANHIGRGIELAEAYANLGTREWSRGRQGQAAELWQRSLDLFADELTDDHPLVAQVRSNFGMALQDQGKFDEAEAMFIAARDLFARLRGADSNDVANAEMKLAFLYVDQHRLEDAEAAALRALEIRRARFGTDAIEVPSALEALGYLRLQRREWHAAAEVLRESLDLRSAGLAADHPAIAGCQVLLGRALTGDGAAAEAEPLLRAAAATRREAFGPKQWRTATAESALGACLLAQDRFEEAEPLLRGGLAGIEAGLRPEHPEVRAARERLAAFCERTGRAEEAARLR